MSKRPRSRRRARELGDVGIEIGHPDQRGIAKRREGVEHVVGGDRGDDALRGEDMGGSDATRHQPLVSAAIQEEIRGRKNRQAMPASSGRSRSRSRMLPVMPRDW